MKRSGFSAYGMPRNLLTGPGAPGSWVATPKISPESSVAVGAVSWPAGMAAEVAAWNNTMQATGSFIVDEVISNSDASRARSASDVRTSKGTEIYTRLS